MARRRHSIFDEDNGIVYLGCKIVLTSNAKFRCPDLGIEGDTIEEVKKEIKAQQVKKEKLPKVEVYFRDSYGDHQWKRGTTTGAGTGYRNSYVWVYWQKDNPRYGRSKLDKRQIDRDYLYAVTENNTAIIKKLDGIKDQIESLENQRRELQEMLDKLPKNVGQIE